ncbi:hypothetical protein C2857_005203 [Epichloe festucae Fl1]|uniref:Uncharacterized protein n=1 Tax=Epichloe festucae (strain Fl1) TaxID=877507 RepID=A0A7U3Q2F0_EPIFF|nr:hypothetical protein C2857_005203 [Epichloe festucae Fl1]
MPESGPSPTWPWHGRGAKQAHHPVNHRQLPSLLEEQLKQSSDDEFQALSEAEDGVIMIDFERAELIKRPRQYRSQLKAKNNQQPSEERDMM